MFWVHELRQIEGTKPFPARRSSGNGRLRKTLFETTLPSGPLSLINFPDKTSRNIA